LDIFKTKGSGKVQVQNRQKLNGRSTSWSSVGAGYKITAAGYANGNELNLTIGAPPTLIAHDGSSGDATTEFPFFIEDIKSRFSGVAPFITQFFSSIWTDGASVALTSGNLTNTQIIDATSAGQSYGATGRSATWIADFTTGTLPTNFSYTNSSGGYGINASGALTWYSTDTPRWDRDPNPISGHPILGLLVEGSMQNMLTGLGSTASENFSIWNPGAGGADVTINTALTSDPMGNGSTSMYRIVDTNSGNGGNVEWASATFTTNIADNTEFVASVFMKSGTSRYAGLQIQSNGGMSAGVVIDFNTGMTKAMTGPYTPQEVLAHGAEKHINDWYRVWVKFNSHVGTHGMVYIFPAFCITAMAVHCTQGEIPAIGTTFVFGAQVEQAKSMSSYYPTNMSSGLRASTDLTINTSVIPAISSSLGTFRLEMNQVDNPTSKTLLKIGAGPDLFKLVALNSGSDKLRLMIMTAGVVQSMSDTDIPLFEKIKNVVMFSYDNSAAKISLGQNSVGYVSSQAFTPPNNITTTSLQVGGETGNSTSYVNMSLRKIHYWPFAIGVPGLKSATRP
jgi:hypothetical protein